MAERYAPRGQLAVGSHRVGSIPACGFGGEASSTRAGRHAVVLRHTLSDKRAACGKVGIGSPEGWSRRFPSLGQHAPEMYCLVSSGSSEACAEDTGLCTSCGLSTTAPCKQDLGSRSSPAAGSSHPFRGELLSASDGAQCPGTLQHSLVTW